MLAEPKRKTVWSTNPRGQYWSQDKSKLGHKLLESMGWKEGTGLGKHNNGIKEHVRLLANTDNKGLGYKTSDDVWQEGNEDYEKLLTDLAAHHTEPSSSIPKQSIVSNLEVVSKKVKNRLHYPKLIKAKNLSQCSEKDLNSIFAKKNIKFGDKSDDKSQKVLDDNQELDSSDKTFESNKNINEYFKSKMDQLKVKCRLFDNSQNNNEDDNYDCDLSYHRDESCSSNSEMTVNNNLSSEPLGEELGEEPPERMRKKKKSKTNKDITKLAEEQIESINSDFHTETLETKKRKKSKKSKKSKKLKTDSSGSDSANSSSEDSNKVLEKNSEESNLSDKFEISLPKGYNKNALSVIESLKNYQQISLAISRDRVLSTSNLISIRGYGCHSD